MANISHIKVNGEVLDIADEVARSQSGGGSALVGRIFPGETLSLTGDFIYGIFTNVDYCGIAWYDGEWYMDIVCSEHFAIEFSEEGNIKTIRGDDEIYYIIFSAKLA